MKIETNRLTLRPIQIEDYKALFEYRKDHETNKYQGWIPTKKEDAIAYIERTSEEIDIAGTWFQLAIIEKDSGEMIGDLGIHFVKSSNKHVEIGITLNKKFHSKGYATEALRRTIDYVFSDLNKHRISASIDPDNKKSAHLLERVGMRKEAHFKESLLINGEWCDDIIYAILKSEWPKSND